MAKDKFSRDMDALFSRIQPSADSRTMENLNAARNRLVGLYRQRLVQINHSVMEIICARHLIGLGYHVEVEYPLDSGALVADIFATRRRPVMIAGEPELTHAEKAHGVPESETLVVEVETGFIPPMAALNPMRYSRARMAAKAARYSRHSDLFGLATPVFNVLPIPTDLLGPPDNREKESIDRLKELCDVYYHSPPVTWESLAASEINTIYIIEVDSTKVSQVHASEYRGTVVAACEQVLCSPLEADLPQ